MNEKIHEIKDKIDLKAESVKFEIDEQKDRLLSEIHRKFKQNFRLKEFYFYQNYLKIPFERKTKVKFTLEIFKNLKIIFLDSFKRG